MVRSHVLAAVAVVGLALGATAHATTYHVSPGGSLKAIIGSLQPGDIVEIEPGTYHEVMETYIDGTPTNPIIIRGVGATRPIFDGNGLDVSGSGSVPRAVIQFEGASNVILENLELKNARNSNGNGAGIRMTGASNVTIRNCKIDYCDMGMMSDSSNYQYIYGCDVGFNGSTLYNGYSHNFYMGGDNVILRGNYIHDSLNGQNYKSRAHYNELWYNWIADSNEGEIGPVEAAETAAANSNTLVIGNTIVSKPNRTGNSMKYVIFGHDGGGAHNGTMYFYNNTCIANSTNNAFLWVDDALNQTRIVAKNNIFYGTTNVVASISNGLSISGSNNWMPTGTVIDPTKATFTSTVYGTSPGFKDAPNRDYRLTASSACVNAGTDTLTYVDGAGVSHSVAPLESYLGGQGLFPRQDNGVLDLGAYEFVATPVLAGDANFDGLVNGADYTIWADHLGATGCAPWYNGGWQVGNFNDDFVVDGNDYAIWLSHYVAGGGTIPEPATLVLVLLLLPRLGRKRRSPHSTL